MAGIRVSPQRRIHILDGDATGGGHGPGRGISGKSEFPSSLSDDQIVSGIEKIANDPGNYTGGIIPKGGKRVLLVGFINGIMTRVVIEPARQEVITAYPLNVSPNP